MRKHLGMRSFYRYDVSVQSESAKHKDRYRRIVTDLYKRAIVSEQDRDEIREEINSEKFDTVQEKIKNVLITNQNSEDTVTKEKKVKNKKKTISAGNISKREQSPLYKLLQQQDKPTNEIDNATSSKNMSRYEAMLNLQPERCDMSKYENMLKAV